MIYDFSLLYRRQKEYQGNIMNLPAQTLPAPLKSAMVANLPGTRIKKQRNNLLQNLLAKPRKNDRKSEN
jgi:hypothetical protein